MRKSYRLENYRKTSVREIMPNDLNTQDTIFGGVISAEVDKLAASIAKDYSNSDVVTVLLYLPFYKPAYKGEELIMKGSLVYVGDTSMGILVDVEAKNYKSGLKRKISECYLVFVAKDEDGELLKLPEPVLTRKTKRLYRRGEKLKEKSIELSKMLYET